MSDSSTTNAFPAAGRIDLHTHLLPGVDDGCQTPAQSLECIRRWIEAGFSGSVCTPHVGPGWYAKNNPDNIAEWMPALRQEVADAGLDYQLWDGGEVRILPETMEWFSYWGLPTLGPGRCVLLDWWGADWPDFCEETLQFLLDNGYQPILAHPERMQFDDDTYHKVISSLLERGVWLQGNLNSIAGGEGKQAQSRVLELLDSDDIYVLASDSHRPADLDQRVEAVSIVEQQYGAERLELLLTTRPREILVHNMIE